MVDTKKLSKIEIAIANAFITGAIVFFSTVTTTDIPTQQNLWSASVGFMLAMLVQLKMLISKDVSTTPPKIGMLI